MTRSTRFSLGVIALALSLGATGCKKKKSDDDMPPVNAQQKKSGKDKDKGEEAKKGPPTVFDFEKAARAEITPENAADKLVALEKEIFLDQEQLKSLPAAKPSKDEPMGAGGAGASPMPAPNASAAKPTISVPKKAPAPKASAN